MFYKNILNISEYWCCLDGKAEARGVGPTEKETVTANQTSGINEAGNGFTLYQYALLNCILCSIFLTLYTFELYITLKCMSQRCYFLSNYDVWCCHDNDKPLWNRT